MGELPVMVPDGVTKPVAESLINSRTKFLLYLILPRGMYANKVERLAPGACRAMPVSAGSIPAVY